MSITSSRAATAVIVLTLVLLSAGIRFYKLGAWSFALDEVGTFRETQSLLEAAAPAPDGQPEAVPRLIPLSFILGDVGYRLFGTSEFGSRVVPALFGVALVGVVFLLCEIVFGRSRAVVIALLVALSPAHIMQSQMNRFYAVAAFFAGLTMLCGSIAAERRSLGWTMLACVFALVGTLTHTVNLLLVPAMFVGIVATSLFVTHQALDRRQVFCFVAAGVALCAFLAYAWPLLHRADGAAWFGYSPGHAVLGSINLLGWPIALMAGFGLVLMFEARSSQRWYWSSLLGAWIAITTLLPLVIGYHPWYSFPFALVGLVIAGFGLSEVSLRLRPIGLFASVAWLGVGLSANVPSLVSHFADGSRTDMRTAAHYVSDHWRAGDRVATVRLDTFLHYAPDKTPAFVLWPSSDGARMLAEQAALGGRLWVVVDSTRDGIPSVLQSWLLEHSTHRLHVTRKRLDYFENTIDVFMSEGGGESRR